MSRSVSSHSDAVEVIYLHGLTFDGEVPHYNEDDEENFPGPSYYEFDEFIDDLGEVIHERYPSFERVDRWDGREDHVVFENGAAGVSVANYNGLYSISLFPLEGGDYDEPFRTAGNATWTGRIAANFRELLHKRFPNWAMVSMGHASNGEGFFRPVSNPESVVTSKEGKLW